MRLLRVQILCFCWFCISQKISFTSQDDAIEDEISESKRGPDSRLISYASAETSDSSNVSREFDFEADSRLSRKKRKQKQTRSNRRRKTAHEHCLDAHNFYRALHNAAPMKTDEKILQWANKRAKDIVRNFNHVRNSPYGENLAWYSKKHGSCKYMVKMWYDEVAMYDFDDPGFSRETGHFTQLVWKGSTRLGCGYYTSDRGTYVSCGYNPPGNVIGQYEENVSPRLG